MKNKLQNIVKKEDQTIGCWNMDNLPSNLQSQFIEKFIGKYPYYETFNVVVGKYVVEVFTVENEVDFNCMTCTEYFNQYGEYPNE